MATAMDQWDLDYLYTGFEDDAFLRDLRSLNQDGEALRTLLSDETLPEAEKLEKLVSASETLNAKLDRLNNFVSCTLATDAANAAANKADDQLMSVYTTLIPLFSGITRFVDAATGIRNPPKEPLRKQSFSPCRNKAV